MSDAGGDPQTVELVTRASAREAAAAIAAGFLDNEIWEWMVPSERLRRLGMPRFYTRYVKTSFLPHRTAWTTADRLGAALWAPPGRWAPGKREQVVELAAMFPWLASGIRRGMRLDVLQHEHHPKQPHWYLNTLSIDPRAQRRGYGTALIQPGLDRADSDGLPCYLETQREANIPFYARFGFELTEKISLPDSPPLWLMLRPAARPRP